jgi:hypothetical protein
LALTGCGGGSASVTPPPPVITPSGTSTITISFEYHVLLRPAAPTAAHPAHPHRQVAVVEMCPRRAAAAEKGNIIFARGHH